MRFDFFKYIFLVILINGVTITVSFALPEVEQSLFESKQSTSKTIPSSIVKMKKADKGNTHYNRSDSTASPAIKGYTLLKRRFTKLNYGDTDTISPSSSLTPDLKKNTLSDLRCRAENNFVARNLLSLIIRGNVQSKSQIGVNSENYYQPFTGQRIASIKIQQLDVFGPTFLDTLQKADNWAEKTGNTLHMRTAERKIKNQLLFGINDFVNPQLMAENEKILRDLPYIHDVAFLISCSKDDSYGVDVLILIKERFEYGLRAHLNSSSTNWELINKNIFGIGHQFSAGIDYRLNEEPQLGSFFEYVATDIGKSFISSGISYNNTYRSKEVNAFAAKQFLSTTTDWAGGIELKNVIADNYPTPYGYTRLDTAARYLSTDLWYGKVLKNKNLYSTYGNFILAGRFLHHNYSKNVINIPENSFYRNHDLILATLGVSQRSLFKNNRIYGYGITEDIPYGRYAELAFGIDKEREQYRPYLHFSYARAMILRSGGYYKWQIATGGYLHQSRIEQGALQLSTNYFSKYVYLNRHPYRFFVNTELLCGINRFKEEYLVINGKYGIRDFSSKETTGINRLKFNIESVRFWATNIDGFRFANYFFADGAFLSSRMKNLFKENFYSGIGLGIRVHNESLVFNVLEIRLSWLPVVPKDLNHFYFSGFGQPKAKFDDFLGRKPQEIQYR